MVLNKIMKTLKSEKNKNQTKVIILEKMLTKEGK